MKSRTGRQIIRRELQLKDYPSLSEVRKVLSPESRLFFHPRLLFHFKSFVGMRKLLSQIVFLVCLTPFRGLIFHAHPTATFAIIGAFDGKTLIGFAYLLFNRRLANGNLIAEMGIVVVDFYQGSGIGSLLMQRILTLAKKKRVVKLFLTVHTNNVKALNLYQKFGFKTSRFLKEADLWEGSKYDQIELEKDTVTGKNRSCLESQAELHYRERSRNVL